MAQDNFDPTQDNNARGNGAPTDYCADLVRERDEDRWLSAQYTSPEDRKRLLALFGLHLEIQRIPFVVSEPPLGEIRLQWFRDALSEIRSGEKPRAHPIIEATAAHNIADISIAELVDGAIDATARMLYAEEFSSVDDLVGWLTAAEVYVDVAAYRLLVPNGACEQGVKNAALAFALARRGQGLAPNINGVSDQARSSLDCAKVDLKKIEAAGAPAAAPAALAKYYLQSKGAFPLRKRLALFSFIAFGRI